HETQWQCVLGSYLLCPHSHLEDFMILGVAWTLVHEVFFYVVFSLLIFHRTLGFLALVAWTAGVIGHAPFVSFSANFVFSPFNLYFLGGVGVGLLHRRWQIPAPRTIAVIGAMMFFGTGFWNLYLPPVHADLALGVMCGGCCMLTLGMVQAEQRGSLRIPQ